MVGLGNGLAQFKQDRLAFGLDADLNSPQAQQAQQFNDFEAQAQPLIGQATESADFRSKNTFNQIKNAGLAGLANQFRRSQKDIAFDTARRGTLGGSRSIERNQGAQAQAEAGIGGVLNQAGQAAEAQRSQELAPVFGAQQQIAQGDPLAQIGTQNQLSNINLQGQAAQGQFDLSNELANIRNATNLNQAKFISGGIGAIGQGIGGQIDQNSRAKQLAALGG